MIYLAKAYLGAFDRNLLKTEIALKARCAGMEEGKNMEKGETKRETAQRIGEQERGR